MYCGNGEVPIILYSIDEIKLNFGDLSTYCYRLACIKFNWQVLIWRSRQNFLLMMIVSVYSPSLCCDD